MKLYIICSITFILSLSSAFAQSFSNEAVCVGTKVQGLYVRDYPQVAVPRIRVEGGKHELSYSYNSSLRLWTYYVTPLEEKDYEILYVERAFWSDVEKVRIGTVKTAKNSLTLNSLIRESDYTARAHSSIVLASGFKVSGATTSFKTEIGRCSSSAALSSLVKAEVGKDLSEENLLSINEEIFESGSGFDFFPNPNEERLLKLRIKRESLPGMLKVYSVAQGTVLYEKKISLDANEVKLPDNLNSGYYIVYYISETGEERYSGKLLIK